VAFNGKIDPSAANLQAFLEFVDNAALDSFFSAALSVFGYYPALHPEPLNLIVGNAARKS
jgi:hypothetical protein